MNKYVLISVKERDITTNEFNNLKEARDEMLKQFYNAMRSDEQLADGSAVENQNEAYVTEGINHDNFDWKIIAV